jgi:outer membrane usher protein
LIALAAAAWIVGRAASAQDAIASDFRAVPAVVSMFLVMPTVNGSPHDVVLMARDGAGNYYVDAETLAEWRIVPPYPPAIEHEGRRFHALAGFPGVVVAVAERSMTATVTVPPELVPGTRLSLAQQRDAISPDGGFGTFLDYDIAYADDDEAADAGFFALLAPTVFTRRGSLSANVLYQSAAADYDQIFLSTPPESWVRLDTAWTRDDPDSMTTLRVGDALTPYGNWARAVRFGGIQFGTNFATQPYAITFPQPTISGSAAVPSSVDILVNGALRSRTQVPSGGFELDDIPVVTGAGQIQVVTRDLLGREQIVTQDFYASERLLRRGLSEYSVNAGALRENFGYASNSYGDFLISGLVRRGMTDLLTIEGRMDATSTTKVAGASIARTVGRFGVSSVALALSEGRESGTLLQLGHEFLGRVYRANVRLQSTRDFTQPGLENLAAWPRAQILVSGGRNFGIHGSLGLSYVDERFADRQSDRRLVTLSYSRPLTRRITLLASASYVDAGDGGAAAYVLVSRRLGPRSSLASSLNVRDDATTLRVDHRLELPVGPGFGYRTSVIGGDRGGFLGEVATNTEHAYYSAEVSRFEHRGAWRLQTHGALAAVDGEFFAARAISDGFAVVDAGGFEDVRVYLENREIGTTNRRGQLLVPNLRPYENNRIRIETADLPLTARIDDPSVSVAPYYRSGAIASFGVESDQSALMRTVLPDGSPLPEGAKAQIGDYSMPVGIDGRLYLEHLDDVEEVEIAYGPYSCVITLPPVRPTTVSIPDLGDIVCRPREPTTTTGAGAPP